MNNNENKNERSAVTTLSEEELAILRAARAQHDVDRSTLPPYDQSEGARARRYVKKNIFWVIFAAVIALIFIAVMGLLIFMLADKLSKAPSKDDFKVTLGDPDLSSRIEYTVPYEDAMINDVFFLDITQIADYADLVVSGGSDNMKLTCEDGTYVRLENGIDTATVNGYRVAVGGTVRITPAKGEEAAACKVPFSFIEKLFSFPTYNDSPGIRAIYSDKDNSVLIRRVTYSSGENEGKNLPISFSHTCFDLAEDFQLRLYRELYPQLEAACVKITMLVNKNNPLGQSYVPEDLTLLNSLSCPLVEGRSFELVTPAALSLSAMMSDMETALGIKGEILVTSAYRSYEYQEKLFSKYVSDLVSGGYTAEAAVAEVMRTSARPGSSEHQSGLCVDLIEKGELSLEVTFENTSAFKWLSSNAHRYGFILRYPADKEELTGYSYEPWHYRFVGIDAATVIYEDKICLEEYLVKY